MRWSNVSVAGEEAVLTEVGNVTIFFGRGPASAGRSPASRATSLWQALGAGVRALRWCDQVHGRVTAALADEVDQPLAGPACVGRCDGLITDAVGIGLLVWTADCVPVIIFGGGVVAAVHSGWRGCAADVAPAVVRRFQVEYGVPATELTAVLGPAIGSCHYPVGEEVLDGLNALETGSGSWRDGHRVDLRAFLHARLQASGMIGTHIVRIGDCTFCDRGLASFRRDGEGAGRQMSVVYRRQDLSCADP